MFKDFFFFAHLKEFSHVYLVMTLVYIWKLQFCKKKKKKNQPFSTKVFFAGHKEHSYDIVYLFFPEEDISPNDIGPHKSFNIPGTVSQPSGGHPTNRQTDAEVLGKLQELYNERWAQRMSHSLRLIWFLQSERYCLVRNVTWAWIIFTQFSSSSVMEVISYWWTSERSFQVFINCWWVSWWNDVILICRIWIV